MKEQVRFEKSCRDLASVLIFAHRRPGHFSKCWRSLAKNPEAAMTELHVFLDGPKNSAESEIVSKTREEASKIEGFHRINLHVADTNRGLSGSILAGIKTVVNLASSWIVLEDDMEVSPYFLAFMNTALATYATNPAVASVHGYVYPTAINLPETFFIKGADCWGWATWRSAWARFEPDGRKLLQQLQKRGLEKEFDLGGVAPFTSMLKDQINEKNDSWAIRWHASAFLAGLYTLYPGRSLVRNTGLDGSGIHCENTHQFDSDLSKTPIQVEPIPVEESSIGRKAFQEFYRLQK